MESGSGHTPGSYSEAFPKQSLLYGCPQSGARLRFPDTFLSSDILESNNSTIKDMQYELAQVCKVWGAPTLPSPRTPLVFWVLMQSEAVCAHPGSLGLHVA